MQPIFLIGFMGCGKSTLGRAAARLSGLQFIDLDKYIETRYHANVRELFSIYGEDGFRDKERRMLHEVAYFENVIIACGGGTPCFFDNIDFMNSLGVTVSLDASVSRLHARLMLGRHRRPLIAAMSGEQLRDFIVKSLDERKPYYDKAVVMFGSDRLDTKEEIEVSARLFLDRLGIQAIA